MKIAYLQPQLQVISLETIRETLQSGSPNGVGANLDVSSVITEDWADLFE